MGVGGTLRRQAQPSRYMGGGRARFAWASAGAGLRRDGLPASMGWRPRRYQDGPERSTLVLPRRPKP